MDVSEILACIRGGGTVTHAELGYLLPKVERQGLATQRQSEHCCGKSFARVYRFRREHFLWVGSYLGQAGDGSVTRVPAIAFRVAQGQPCPALLAITCCRVCGRHWRLLQESPQSVVSISGDPPTFATVSSD